MNTTREIETAVTARALVRIAERNGFHKGVTGIAMGYQSTYDSIKVGFIDANGNYTGDYTVVSVQHVEVIEAAPETTQEATEAAPELPTTNTPATKKSSRTARRNKARRTLAARSATTRATARIRRNGEASLSTYGVAAGLGIRAARSVASALRDKAKALHLTGTAHRVHAAGRMRTGQRYTPAQVVLMALAYKPGKPEYRTARAHLLLAA